MSIVVARALAMLVLFVVALALSVFVYRNTNGADALLILLSFWFLHGIAYYLYLLYTFLTQDPYPRDLALIINMWSTALRFQITLSLIGILIFHCGRVWRG